MDVLNEELLRESFAEMATEGTDSQELFFDAHP